MGKFNSYLAHNIKKARNDRNLTQSKLADLCDTSTNYIGLIEVGKRFPSGDFLERLSRALELEPYQLFLEPGQVYSGGNDRKSRIIKKISAVLDSEVL